MANPLNGCAWSKAMYGVDASKAAGQAYYNSIAKLYAQWGVDYIKADDMSRAEDPWGEMYHRPEIEALRKAMTSTGRPMALSLSPGPTSLTDAANVAHYSQLWRISNDVWDNWQQVANQFGFCRHWAAYGGPGHWPDADMLPLGHLCVRGFGNSRDFVPRMTRLTHDEQRTLMTLWLIFRSPLMIGAVCPLLAHSRSRCLLTPRRWPWISTVPATGNCLRAVNRLAGSLTPPAAASMWLSLTWRTPGRRTSRFRGAS